MQSDPDGPLLPVTAATKYSKSLCRSLLKRLIWAGETGFFELRSER